MMLFHILMSVSDHELMLDYFLLRSSVGRSSQGSPSPRLTNESLPGDFSENEEEEFQGFDTMNTVRKNDPTRIQKTFFLQLRLGVWLKLEMTGTKISFYIFYIIPLISELFQFI